MKRRREAMVSTVPKVKALLADGIEAFGARLSDRVLREQRDEVFLKHCPRWGPYVRRQQPSSVEDVSFLGMTMSNLVCSFVEPRRIIKVSCGKVMPQFSHNLQKRPNVERINRWTRR